MQIEKIYSILLSDLLPMGIYKRNHKLYTINTELVMLHFAINSKQYDLAEVFKNRLLEDIERISITNIEIIHEEYLQAVKTALLCE